MIKNILSKIIKGIKSRQKYLGGIFVILVTIVLFFSCDIQDLSLQPNQNPESRYRSTLTSNQLAAQQPYSFTHTLSDSVPVVTMPAVEVQTLLAEDRAERQQNRSTPPRFGKALDVNLNLDNSGRWDKLSDGSRLWRLSIASQEAYSINFIFDRYKLPPGGKLFIYNKDHSTVLGAFTEANNKPYSRFSTLPVDGALITLEYYEPAEERKNTALRIGTVIHAYRDLFNTRTSTKTHKETSLITTSDLGDSGSCEINVNCPEGYAWQDESRAVAMVLLDQNTRLCSGALVNNVTQDRTPYFLSAFHCADSNLNGSLSSTEITDAEDWLFWFNYESETCSDPISEPGNNAVSGAFYRAGNVASDFLLLELSSSPPTHSGYAPYFAGWDASGNVPNSSVTIHHPSGDIKKISSDSDPAVSSDYTPDPGPSPNDSHWRIIDWDDGTTEGGSSGAPLFNQNHRVIGQLHGGYAACGNDLSDYFGKFSMSWNYGSSASERLKDWLDPNNTGTVALGGMGSNPLQVYIDGPYQIQTNQYYEFEAATSGGYQPYSWQWQIDYGQNGTWQNVGGDSKIYTHISYNTQDFNLRVQVTDAGNDTQTSTIHPVTVSSGGAASQDTSLNDATGAPSR